MNQPNNEISLAAAGNQSAQRNLFAYYFPYIMSITLRYMTTREEAEEMLNDVFLKIFNNLTTYDPTFPFKIWIRKIAINNCIDRLRALKRFPSFSDLGLLANNLTDSDDDDLAFQILENDGEPILPILQSLSPRYRAVFNLYVFEDYSHKEIADLLGISVGTSKSNYARAKGIIKNTLEKKMKEENINNAYMALNSDSF